MIFFRRFAIVKEFFCMIRDKKQWFLIPLLIAILIIALFIFAVELPALFPFFYAVF